ncbi:hypothetical protein ACFO9Q_19365 [Paenibacillus sp. GCM10023252]|uniref:hypothetical protein n=1 Tax=Paenibacillus sp. GCM10023252 TaxID=3252649 RepID=UPI00361B280F
MKSWRVGTLSMGVTLLLIGVTLALSLWQGKDAYNALLWAAPFVFILLGAELLVYLKVASGSERTIVRYDWMSLFFVGVVGAASLLLALLASSGLLEEFQQAMDLKDRSTVIQTEAAAVPAAIKKIVVQAQHSLVIDTSEARDVQLLGQVRYRSVEPIKQEKQVLHTNTVGTTLYVIVDGYDVSEGVFGSEYVNPQLTLVVPAGVKVEQRGF